MDKLILILTGLVVAAIVLVLARRAGLSLLTLFFIALPFPLSIVGEGQAGNVSASDVIAGLLLLTLIGRQWRFGAAGMAVSLFLIVAAASSLLSSPPKDVVLGLGRMVLISLAPLVIFASNLEPVRQLRDGLTAYCISTTVLAGCSLYAFASGGIGGSMYTLGINKNSLGPIFGSAVVVLFAAIMAKVPQGRRMMTVAYGMLGACAIGLVLCLSRGGWVGTAAGILVAMAATGRVKPAVISAVLLTPIFALIWSMLPADRVEYASDISLDSYVLKTRLNSMALALDAFEANPVLGAGIGLERIVEPHNVFVLTLGELGVVGFVVFTAMVGTAVVTLIRPIRCLPRGDATRAVLVAAISAFTVYHVQTLIDVYWRRGVGALSWACVGTAVAVAAARLPVGIANVPIQPQASAFGRRRWVGTGGETPA